MLLIGTTLEINKGTSHNSQLLLIVIIDDSDNKRVKMIKFSGCNSTNSNVCSCQQKQDEQLVSISNNSVKFLLTIFMQRIDTTFHSSTGYL